MDDLDLRRLQSPGGAFFSNLPPQYAALMRGVVLGIVLVVVKALIDYLSGGNVLPSGWDIYAPLILALLRTLEGTIDQHSVNAGMRELGARETQR